MDVEGKASGIEEELAVLLGEWHRHKVFPGKIFFVGKASAYNLRTFQSIFGLPATGVVDYPTWYKISEIYVGVSRIAELT